MISEQDWRDVTELNTKFDINSVNRYNSILQPITLHRHAGAGNVLMRVVHIRHWS